MMFITSSCKSEENIQIIKYLERSQIINFENTLFTPEELIKLCSDSVGQKKFKKSLDLTIDMFDRMSADEVNEKKLLLFLIKSQVRTVEVRYIEQENGKRYIENNINITERDFTINEELVYKRFHSEDELSFCPSCISMFIFIIYNPELYVKVRKMDSKFYELKNKFPVSYILQDCNIPIEICKRRQEKLLELLKSYNDPILKTISEEINNCDLNNRCD